MKQTTYAVVLIDKEGSILGCHSYAYGKKENTGYDFPKGCKEESEEDIDAACRELYEETNIRLTNEDKKDLIDLGTYKHNKEKNIHIYLLKVEKFPDISLLKCNSFFERHGKEYPEVNGWKVIKKDERTKTNKSNFTNRKRIEQTRINYMEV